MGNRLILILGILSSIFIFIIIGAHSSYYYRHNIRDQEEKALALTETAFSALASFMLEGEMDKIQDILVSVGKLEHLKHIHIIDEKGRIGYSSQPEKINTQGAGKFLTQALTRGEKVSGLEEIGETKDYCVILPIKNEPRCYSCHRKGTKILGALEVALDWKPVRKILKIHLRNDIIVAFLFYAFILLMSVLFGRLYNNAQTSLKNLKAAQEQLVKTEKMAAVGQMAAAISHDLRNPLTGIKMAAYYLGTKIDKSELELNNILRDIELEIDYASNVVTNILTYAKPVELIYTHADINKLLEDTITFVHLQNRDLTIKLVKKYAPNIPEIFIDSKQIKQVFINVLTNAIQAMPNGGTLSITTRLVGRDLEVEIKDTGLGISKDDFGKIFDPFFTTKARGVGLGLSISNNIINKHGGKMKIISELGLGTTFLMSLPVPELKTQDKDA